MIDSASALSSALPSVTIERVRSTMPDIPVIEFVRSLPGFPDLRRFALVQLDGDGGGGGGGNSSLCQLRSLDDPELRFLVMPPMTFFPAYAPEIDDETVTDLSITSAEDVLVLLVLNAGQSLDTTTANLLAPILVNLVTREACQVILDDPALSVRAALVA